MILKLPIKKKIKEKNAGVVPYIQAVAHNLKKTGKRAGVNVVFSAPEKLIRLCSKANTRERKRRECGLRHHNQFAARKEEVVYSLPLDCKRSYIAQTGRCIYDRLREHHNKVEKLVAESHLAAHRYQCGCKSQYDKCRLIGKGNHRINREIIYAFENHRQSDKCVSMPSVALSEKELKFLANRE